MTDTPAPAFDASPYAFGLIAEECGEVLQLIGKALRFGHDTPGRLNALGIVSGETPRSLMPAEVGDLLAAIEFTCAHGLLDRAKVEAGRVRKLAKLMDPNAKDNLGRQLAPQPAAPATADAGGGSPDQLDGPEIIWLQPKPYREDERRWSEEPLESAEDRDSVKYLRADLVRSVDFFAFKPTHKHLKSDGLYQTLDVVTDATNATNGRKLVLYRNADGRSFVRLQEEFNDGRFRHVSQLEDVAHPAPEASAVPGETGESLKLRFAKTLAKSSGFDPDGCEVEGTPNWVAFLDQASEVLAEARATQAPFQPVYFPRQPDEAMLNAARDWSLKKYGRGVGNDGATGCWQAMYDAALQPAQSVDVRVAKL